MLTCQKRRRHEHRHLIACLYSDECRTHCHFGLAKAYITTNQAVHRLGLLHIINDGVNSGSLVNGLFKGELTGEQLILRHIHPKADTCFGITPCLYIEQFGGDIVNLLKCFELGFFPLTRANLGQRHRFRVRAAIATNQGKIGNRHIDAGIIGVF